MCLNGRRKDNIQSITFYGENQENIFLIKKKAKEKFGEEVQWQKDDILQKKHQDNIFVKRLQLCIRVQRSRPVSSQQHERQVQQERTLKGIELTNGGKKRKRNEHHLLFSPRFYVCAADYYTPSNRTVAPCYCVYALYTAPKKCAT